MNKKLIAAAIAAAMAAPAAYADATVYGQLKVRIDSVDAGEGMTSDGSRLGFKGSEDLGNGMKAIFKLEFGIDPEDGGGIGAGVADSDSSRSQYVGLSGNFGTVMLGKRETNYLLTTAKLDLFGDTLADYNNILGFDENGATGSSRPNNAIHYVSPSFSGMTVSAGLYGQDGGDLNGGGYDLAAVYSNGGIHASIAYSDTDTTDSAVRVGLGYKMDAIQVTAVYENQSDDDNVWQISGAYTMGNNTIKATFGDTEDGVDGQAWAIGVDHKMSKRTKVYALYADSDLGLQSDAGGAAGDGFSLGMQHNF